MHDDHDRPLPLSRSARYLFSYILRRGGCLRIGPLARWSGLPGDSLADAINELAERRWVLVVWRTTPRTHLPPGLPERFREVDRVATTRWGRWRYPASY